MMAGLSAQSSAYNEEIYKDYGTFRIETDEGNVVSLSAFITVNEEEKVVHEEEIVKQKAFKQSKYKEPEIEYHYELYLVSKSTYQGDSTNTWVQNLKIYVDGEDVLINQFPDGKTLSIGLEPTLVYTHHCLDRFCEFELTWERVLYEPRTRK
jgi:hypothetical protein